MSDERFDRIEHTLNEHTDRFQTIDQRFEAIDRRFEAIDRRFDDLEQHMHVLHEEVITRIAAIPDNTARLEARMDRGFAELKEAIDRRPK